MNSKVWMKKALSTCLILVTIVAYSMVALANSEKIAGELLIAGTDNNVTVNGETAKNGRSVFSSSTIVTPENTSAIINVGKLGSVKLAPKTTLNLAFNEKGITGDLLAGKITVLNATNSVEIITLDGKLAKLNAGESATAKVQDDDDATGASSGTWFVWAIILGGAAAGIILAATQSNDVQLGGGTTVVSPNR